MEIFGMRPGRRQARLFREDSGQALIEAILWSFLIVCITLGISVAFRREYALYRKDLVKARLPFG